MTRVKSPYLMMLSLVAVLWCSCGKPTHYKNASLQKLDETLIFRGDPSCEFEPMPLNTKVGFAPHEARWGAAWMGVYRETGVGAVNRTITLSVLYLGALDARLDPLTPRPHRVVVFDRDRIQDPKFHVFPSEHGVRVAYTVAPEEVRCAELNLRVTRPIVHPEVCRFLGRHLTNGERANGWAMRHHMGFTYALMYDQGFVVTRSADPRRAEEVGRLTEPGPHHPPAAADLLVRHDAIIVVWSQVSDCPKGSPAAGASCAPWRWARLSPRTGRWIRGTLPAQGTPEYLQVRLFEEGTVPFALIQMGTRVVRQELPWDQDSPGPVAEVVDLKAHSDATRAGFLCRGDDCWIHFARDERRSFVFSTRSGLQTRPGLDYPLLCGRAGCLAEGEAATLKPFTLP